MRAKKIIFITGTGTGVGKTLLSASLLHHLRYDGVRALAMKPFCSGSRGDVRLLQSLQRGELSDDRMNPHYFAKALAPLVAAAKQRPPLRLAGMVREIRSVESECDRLIIEGSGGLLVPLAPGCTVADLIAALDCRVAISALNQLGTINHTLLTVQALRSLGVARQNLAVVLMSRPKPDLSSRTNPKVLADLLHAIPVLTFPWLGSRAGTAASIRAHRSKVRKTLNRLV